MWPEHCLGAKGILCSSHCCLVASKASVGHDITLLWGKAGNKDALSGRVREESSAIIQERMLLRKKMRVIKMNDGCWHVDLGLWELWSRSHAEAIYLSSPLACCRGANATATKSWLVTAEYGCRSPLPLLPLVAPCSGLLILEQRGWTSVAVAGIASYPLACPCSGSGMICSWLSGAHRAGVRWFKLLGSNCHLPFTVLFATLFSLLILAIENRDVSMVSPHCTPLAPGRCYDGRASSFLPP